MSFIAYQIVIRWFQNKKVSEPFPPELQSSAVLINLVAKIKQQGRKFSPARRHAVAYAKPFRVCCKYTTLIRNNKQKQEKFHHGRKKHSISRRKGKKRHPPGGQRPTPAKGGHNGCQPLPAELPRCRLPRWRRPAMATHKKTGLQISRRQVHATHLAARPPHAIHRVPDRARAGPHLRPRTIRRKRNTISYTVKGFLMQSSKDRIVIVIHGDKVYTYMRKYWK